MENNLEKLYSYVLFNWLKFKQLSDDTEVGSVFGTVAGVLENCLSSSGFETDINDFTSELLVQKGESV